MNDSQLNSYETYLQLRELGSYYMADFQLRNAYNLAKTIEKKLVLEKKDEHNKLYTGYRKLITRLNFFALNICREYEILDLFQNHIADALGIRIIDIKDRFKALMINTLVMDRDAFKRKLRERLALNNQLLTKDSIVIEGKQRAPTVGGWVDDYIKTVGAGEVSNISTADYLTRSKNVLKLDPSEKNKVYSLIELYNILQVSSQTAEGLEEDLLFGTSDGAVYSLSKGIIEKVTGGQDEIIEKAQVSIKTGLRLQQREETFKLPELSAQAFQIQEPTEKPHPMADEILNAYQGDPKDFQEQLKEEVKLKKMVKDDNKKLRQEFYTSVQNKNVHRTVAVLRLLVRMNDLDKFLSEDEKLKKYLTAVWTQKYGAKEANIFALNSSSGHSLQLFVQYILQERLGVEENNAARIGVQISNIYKQLGRVEYSQLAFFDISSKTFRWMGK